MKKPKQYPEAIAAFERRRKEREQERERVIQTLREKGYQENDLVKLKALFKMMSAVAADVEAFSPNLSLSGVADILIRMDMWFTEEQRLKGNQEKLNLAFITFANNLFEEIKEKQGKVIN